MTTNAERRDAIAAEFQQRYGASPTTWVRAPGRVDLMGSHTDYNEGPVLTVAIDRDTWIAARPRDDGRMRFSSMNTEGEFEFSIDEPDAQLAEGWALYVQGTVMVFKLAGHKLTGCDALVHGTLPISSGLSSSASLEVAVGELLQALGDYRVDRLELAKLCQQAENQVVGVNCGILDQYSSVFGELHQVLALDCRDLTHTYARYPKDLRTVICNTSAPRTLAGSLFDDRRADCEAAAAHFAKLDPSVRALRDVPPELFIQHESELPEGAAKRGRFIVEEIARVFALKEALENYDRDAIATIAAKSFAGAKNLFEVCIPAMESMMESMLDAPGVVGARQAGAGFGGCMVAFVERDRVDDFAASVEQTYHRATGLEPAIYISSTSPGSGRVDGNLGHLGSRHFRRRPRRDASPRARARGYVRSTLCGWEMMNRWGTGFVGS